MFHAKDGDSRPDLPNGYEMTPFGLGDIDYPHLPDQHGRPKGYHHPMWEQDTAPSTENLGQSLELAELSYDMHGDAFAPDERRDGARADPEGGRHRAAA